MLDDTFTLDISLTSFTQQLYSEITYFIQLSISQIFNKCKLKVNETKCVLLLCNIFLFSKTFDKFCCCHNV